jgi:pimeloyl-ACP methyl ester carboxylesterase
MIHKIILVGLFALLLCGEAAPLSAQAGHPNVAPTKCPFEIPHGFTVECGIVSAPEDHHRLDGRMIGLAIAVVHKDGVKSAPDPLLYIDGGPGAHTLRIAPYLIIFLAPVLDTRDVILFDQRGVGFSQPALDCLEATAQSLEERIQDMTREAQQEKALRAIAACHDRLIGAGVNLSVYNTTQSAADVAALRIALGYEGWNLFGVSYGTRVALTAMRDHPAGIRSVILDSPAPLNVDALADRASSAEIALQRLFDDCAADALCRLAYPDLQMTYARLIADLNAAPTTVDLPRPFDDEMIALKMNGDLFEGIVAGLLSNALSIARVPALIDGVARGDDSLLVRTMSPMLAGVAVAGRSDGQGYSVICADEAPLAADPTEELSAICSMWNIDKGERIRHEAVTSDVPTLILAGRYDAATPPKYARLAAETLSRSVMYELPSTGHSVMLNTTCAGKIIRSFLDNPAAPDASCIAAMESPRFLITLWPTHPLAHIAVLGSGLFVAGSIATLAGSMMRLQRRKQIAWRISLRRGGWLPLVLSGAGIVGLIVFGPMGDGALKDRAPFDLTIVVEAVIPLAIAIQAALLFSPGDEPALEVMLAAPRPIQWVVLERYLAAFALQTSVGIAGTALVMTITHDSNVGLAILRWLPAAIFMSGLTLFVTLRSRQPAMGVIVAILLWFVMLVGRETFLPVEMGGEPFRAPLDLIQPMLWLVHVHLDPDQTSAIGYAINRIVVTGVGCLLIALAVNRLRDTEQVLLGARAMRIRSSDLHERT